MEDHTGERDTGGAAALPTPEKLRAYVSENYGKFTDAALTAELTRAGYASEDIRAALVDAARTAPPSSTGRAVRTVLISYGLTFAVLSLGMLANTRPSGHLMPDAEGGIAILAVSLGAAFLASLVWVASRRAVFALVGAGLALSGVMVLRDTVFGGYGGGIIQALIMLVIGVGLVALVMRTAPAPSERTSAALGVLLVAPMLLLVALAGLCVATGLPIPGG